MSMFKKYDASATTKTHGEVDATLADVLVPTVPLADSASNLARAAVYALGGWIFRGKQLTGSFSL